MDQQIEHFELNELLRRSGSSWNAGQVHGLLCSRVSVCGPQGATLWFAQVLAEADATGEARSECEATLDRLYAATWHQLVERQSAFHLVLPDDHTPIAERAAALGLWCDGYLHGLVAEKSSDDLKSRLAAEPVSDVIKDMLQITRAMAENDDDGDEEAFAELVEYLRVATQLVYEVLAEFRVPDREAEVPATEPLH